MEEIKIKIPEELKTEPASKLLGETLIKLVKQDISERFRNTKKITDDDWEFCEQIDWHPVDELPPKPEHLKELKKTLREKPIGKMYNSAEEFFVSQKNEL